MLNRVRPAILAIICALAASAATLEQLSMDQLNGSATSIVRASVQGSHTSVVNGTVYTHYTLRVSEVWKGAGVSEVMVPGGISGNYRQAFPGVPELESGKEYVLFIWKSSTGITHLLGLTQGLFEVTDHLATRAKIGEMMLDAAGRKVADKAVTMSLTDMRLRAVGAAK